MTAPLGERKKKKKDPNHQEALNNHNLVPSIAVLIFFSMPAFNDLSKPGYHLVAANSCEGSHLWVLIAHLSPSSPFFSLILPVH